MSQSHRAPARLAPLESARLQPFVSAEEAWLWTMAALIARQDGARIVAGRGLVQRPCEPDDVVRSLDRLYRQRRIDLGHARVLRRWGERQQAPDARQPGEEGEARLWHEALSRLEWPLRVKGIVAEGPSRAGRGATIHAFPGP